MPDDNFQPQSADCPTLLITSTTKSFDLAMFLRTRDGPQSGQPGTQRGMSFIQHDRLPLVAALQSAIGQIYEGGMSDATLDSIIWPFKAFFEFADKNGTPFTLDTAADVFRAWTAELNERAKLTEDAEHESAPSYRPLTHRSAYRYCLIVTRILDVALAREVGLMELSSVKARSKRAQNLVCLKPVDEVHGVSINLLFPSAKFSSTSTPWNLNVLLYRGGASTNVRIAQRSIDTGALGAPLYERLPLVCSLHEELNAKLLASGGRKTSIDSILVVIKMLFQFADREGLPMTMGTVTDAYCLWVDSLIVRARFPSAAANGKSTNRKLSERSLYNHASVVGNLLNTILERHTHIIELTGVKYPDRRKSAIGVEAEKQNLEKTFGFGHFLADVCDAMTIEVVKTAPLPHTIALRSGRQVILKESNAKIQMVHETGLGRRYILANIRISAEICMFIGQTAMNITQVQELRLRRFFFTGHIDGYQVRDYKERRHGPVLFEIFKDYKLHFERYLAWRRAYFPNSTLLFPLIRRKGSLEDSKFIPSALRELCEQASVAYITPQDLRNTRVNWLLRRTSDPDATAEMAQHSKRMLLRVYHRPSLQRAMGEAIRFWNVGDPSLNPIEAVSPGLCESEKPQQSNDVPSGFPVADCRRPSGCLWCEHHRDVESLDYVWALVSFKHLKIIELSLGPIPKPIDEIAPAKLVIDRIDEKLEAIAQDSQTRREWVSEAQTRVEEGDFHPSFSNEIEELENNQ